MNYNIQHFESDRCTAQISSFKPEYGTEEVHIMFHRSPKGYFDEQLNAIHRVKNKLLAEFSVKDKTVEVIFQRYFLSDAANQAGVISEQDEAGNEVPTSIIQQPPLDGSKVALWIYLRIELASGKSEKPYNHLWIANKYESTGNVREQSETILSKYDRYLNSNNCTLKDNCIRTWFFVQDVDTNYADFVNARKVYFDACHLTEKTHYIVSTGIEGRNVSTSSLVTMDAYAIEGIRKEQIAFLYALSHLSPTHIYGVTFERGVAVQSGDRKHIYISGTASIDDQGKVVQPGDVKAQTIRMLENIEMLLKEADAGMDNIAQAIVYLRDTADYATVERMLKDKYPCLPIVITLAPVCRPTWLIEMECIAITAHEDKRFADF